MADIVRCDPWAVMDREFPGLSRLMDRFFEDGGGSRFPLMGWDEGTLPLDVYEQDAKVVVKASVPGFAREDIDVQLHEGVLAINAKHSEQHEQRDARWYRRELRYGSVSRRLALPGIIDDANVDAELHDGVLTLTIPIPEQAKPRQIEIRTANGVGATTTE